MDRLKRYVSVISILLFALVLIAVMFINKPSLYAKALNSVDKISLEINEDISKMINSKDTLSYSSSPYVIVKDNDEYNDLVSLGISAVKPLSDKIENSDENGLIEYIYAMAIEDIMSQKYSTELDIDEAILKTNGYTESDINYGWSNAKEFETAFKTFMNNIPVEYSKIKLNDGMTEDEKISALTQLGLGVVPYIIDDIENNTDCGINYEEALISVLTEKGQISITTDSLLKSSGNFDINSWISENSEQYELLKQIK